MKSNLKVPIIVRELAGLSRRNEPITRGIPIRKGLLFDTKDISLMNARRRIPVQTQILSQWSDSSIKWLLLDFQTSLKAKESLTIQLCKKRRNIARRILVSAERDKITVDTGKKIFVLSSTILTLLGDNNEIVLIDDKNKKYIPRINRYFIETNGRLRSTIRFEGEFKNKKSFGMFIARFSFYYRSSLVKLDFTLRNPRAAVHKGGFWDLGHKGSIFFKDLSLRIKSVDNCEILYKETVQGKYEKSNSPIIIYQDSSGNKNWKSRNHVNRNNKVMHTFKGYKTYSDGNNISGGNHAQPVICLKGGNSCISVAIKEFWQNFPKALETKENEIIIRLFPKYYNDLHELQGGEQKTHTIFFDFEGNDLSWIQQPLVAGSTLQYYAQTKAIPYLTPLSRADKRYQKLIDSAIEGPKSFENKNAVIDEYGWRHYGDIYADHEAIDQTGLISHYNNQYDVICGAFLQYFRSNNTAWFDIADRLARHVIDIDIYHTNKDKSAYNGGMFWHTFHYVEAGTSTHRSFSRLSAEKMSKFGYGVGGGPGSEHNYASGLMYHYFITGEFLSKEAVIGLANWVISMDDGSKSVLRFLNHKSTGKASHSGSVYYHGPGRGSGNSLNVLIEGYEITNDKKYLLKIEELIRRCIHPKENIAKNDLANIEHKWFYLVFLQALGRYLDLKMELDQLDYMFYYARESLIHYAKWMLKNEVPYKEVLHKVYLPTETWPAQDIRKTYIFDYAYKYGPPALALKFKERAKYFFNRCIDDLNTFKTKTLLRPLAILMSQSVMHDHFRHFDQRIRYNETSMNFGKPKQFKPQGYYLHKLKDLITSLRPFLVKNE